MKRKAIVPQPSSTTLAPTAPDSSGSTSPADWQTTVAQMPWVPLPECLSRWTGFVLCWVSDLGTQFYTSAIAPLHLRPEQLGILTLLQSEGAIVQARLGERLRIDKATMVHLLNDLEQQGLIERRPHASDRRAFEVHLLECGQQRIQAAEEVSIAAAKQFFAALSPDEQRVLHELLARLATSTASLIPTPDQSDDKP